MPGSSRKTGMRSSESRIYRKKVKSPEANGRETG